MKKYSRVKKWAALLSSGMLFTHCSTTVEDAVLEGVSGVITDATYGFLSALLPFDFLQSNGGGGSGGGGSSDDPFSGPPVQT